jgi:hypothetical protein
MLVTTYKHLQPGSALEFALTLLLPHTSTSSQDRGQSEDLTSEYNNQIYLSLPVAATCIYASTTEVEPGEYQAFFFSLAALHFQDELLIGS